jgi:hypothetical protein
MHLNVHQIAIQLYICIVTSKNLVLHINEACCTNYNDTCFEWKA